MTNTAKTKPVQVIKFGCARVAVWNYRDGAHSVTVERIYKDKKEDAWRSTTSFGRDDLPKLIKALDKAYESLFTADKQRE